MQEQLADHHFSVMSSAARWSYEHFSCCHQEIHSQLVEQAGHERWPRQRRPSAEVTFVGCIPGARVELPASAQRYRKPACQAPGARLSHSNGRSCLGYRVQSVAGGVASEGVQISIEVSCHRDQACFRSHCQRDGLLGSWLNLLGPLIVDMLFAC